jgi:hypothetical protein
MESSLSVNGLIEIHKGHLVVPLGTPEGSKSLIIHEQTLEKYAEFLKHWNTAIAECLKDQGASVANLWAHSEVFRLGITLALRAVGVENPQELKPVQLEELILTAQTIDSDDRRGLLFRLHSDVPKMMG